MNIEFVAGSKSGSLKLKEGLLLIRADGRKPDELREVRIVRDFIPHAEGSVLIEVGRTRVICTASFEEGVPGFRKGTGSGWITAEYSMLPRATPTRKPREMLSGRADGRSVEIQRLIGRALRSVADLSLFPDRTFWIDCDVIEADGGTRTAAITGAYVALRDAIQTVMEEGDIETMPLRDFLAAVSVGMVSGTPCLDLCFEEDFNAEMDMNLVATGDGRIVEIQGTAEGRPLTREELNWMVELGLSGISRLVDIQRLVLSEPRPGAR